MRAMCPRRLPPTSFCRTSGLRGRILVASLATLTAMSLSVGCGDDTAAPDEPVEIDVAGVYVAVIDHLVMGGDEAPKTLFIEALAPSKVSISDQAEIIKAFDAETSVRFVDEHVEAVDDEDDEQVRNDGVLVQVGETEANPEHLSVTATRYINLSDTETRCFTLSNAADKPVAVLTSTVC